MQSFSYTIEQLQAILKAELLQKAHSVPVQDIVYDSRRQNSGEHSLFVALKGTKRDGNAFVNHAYKQGIRNFLISEPIDIKKYPEANFLRIGNTLGALRQLAAYHRNRFTNLAVLAITGSNGKTIVKEWLYHVLNEQIKLIRSPNSYNSQIGVPLSLILIEPDRQLAIIEAGISKKGEMARLEQIIRPTIGIVTHLGDAHQINFKDKAEKLNEKLKLFKGVNYLIHAYDEQIIRAVKKLYPQIETISCGVHSQAKLFLQKVEPQKDGRSLLHLIYRQKKYSVYIPFSNAAAIENALYVIAFLLRFSDGKYFDAAKFASLPNVAMRLELSKAQFNSILINDAYNVDLNSLNIALDFLNQQSADRHQVLILSDIVQSLPDSELYQQLAQQIEKAGIKVFIAIGEELCAHKKNFSWPIITFFFKNTAIFLQEFDFSVLTHSAILLKGARNFTFEKIAAKLISRHHSTRMEINLSALEYNLNLYRKQLHSHTKIMVMVKAFSYGSGTDEIARWLEYQQVDYLGVAYADEGMQLRQAGIKLPLMVMNTAREDFETIFRYKLEPEIYNFLIFSKFSEFLKLKGIKQYPVHIKLDTGMHRLGFNLADLPELLSTLKENSPFKVVSVFSHLAAADDDAERAFTLEQISLFGEMTAAISHTLQYPFLRHILNSAGIENFSDALFDMVRLGIGLYGISPSKKFKLKSVSSLKTIVSQIKVIEAGETIGYNRIGKLATAGKIATIPIGYADGLRRELGDSNFKVYIKGRFAPVVGRICMDMTMIDISHSEVNEGDEVEIFGTHQSVAEIAQKLRTIAYEVLTGISPRVKRIYFYE